jgi:Lipocalin-like domain
MFYIVIILAGIFAMPASAQSLKDQLVGTWTLASCNDPNFPACAGDNGIIMYAADGRYVSMVAARGRPKVTPPNEGGAAGANRGGYTPEQYKSIAAGLFAQFGTWSVNEANKTVTLHVDGALFPNIEGTDWATFTPIISGDELKGIAQNGQPGLFVWRRVK